MDVTAQAPAGGSVMVGYQALYENRQPWMGLGDVDMNSWLIVWE